MGVPLMLSDDAIGILSLAREVLNPYNYSEVTLAQTFFIQVTSHELRTPLTVMLGYSQILLQNQGVKGDPTLPLKRQPEG
jgi:signal transduction histidine kinase